MSAEFTQQMAGEPEATELAGTAVEGGVKNQGGQLRALLEQMTTGSDPGDEQEEAIEYPQEATAAPYSPQNIQPEAQYAPDPEIKGNPYARARVLERDNKKLRQKQADLEAKLNQVLDRLAGGGQQEQVEQEPEDPVERIHYGIKKVADEQAALREEMQLEKQREKVSELASDANQTIQQFASRVEQVAPGAYKGAVAHLANLWISEKLEDEDLSEEEAQFEVAKKAETLKLKWRSEGRDPGEEFFKRAIAAGFRFNVLQPQENATQQIQKEVKKRKGVASISGMSGAPTKNPMKRVINNTLTADSGREYHRTMSEMAKARGGYNKRISLSEILADKMIPG